MAGKNPRLLNAIFSVTRPRHPASACRPSTKQARRHATSFPSRGAGKSADDPDFVSIVDAPPQIVSTKRKHNKFGIALLASIPIIAFALGTWQVQRLDWKTKLIAKFEDRLVRPPLPLPPRIDPDAIHDFDYRRVYATGRLRHDKEMLVGPRMHDGKNGFFVVTPLERENGSTILVNRGWVSKEQRFQKDRDPSSLPEGEVTVSGLLREPWKKNLFTPDNKPGEGKFYFPDVEQMARVSGSEAVWIEETMMPSLLESYAREEKGVPIGRAPEVNLRNNHVQYIVTWYVTSLSLLIITHQSLGIRYQLPQPSCCGWC
ncbi:surf-like protein [Neophaeococcomyces mojaviensis]|uniref:Surf-like protein n=1 Tax=Neophaeococcomyces mojaviensis TaxID=3383035 RepID=A0ACC3AIH8_9EURO|nr:surf-like protein [Knufia sp. JES_112]